MVVIEGLVIFERVIMGIKYSVVEVMNGSMTYIELKKNFNQKLARVIKRLEVVGEVKNNN